MPTFLSAVKEGADKDRQPLHIMEPLELPFKSDWQLFYLLDWEKLDAREKSLLGNAIMKGLGIILLGGLCLAGIWKSVSKRSRVLYVAEQLRTMEKDFTKKIEVASKDETGELARWFNTFIEKMREIIKEIADVTETLSTSSNELSTIAGQMSSNSEQASEKSSSVAGAMEEMSSNMVSVSAP